MKGYTNFEGQDFTPVSDVFETSNEIEVTLTSKELHMLYEWFNGSADEELHRSNSKGYITDEELEQHNDLYNKLRQERFNFFKTKNS
jgi:hypothetical protein